jgi:hypothetical protein
MFERMEKGMEVKSLYHTEMTSVRHVEMVDFSVSGKVIPPTFESYRASAGVAGHGNRR